MTGINRRAFVQGGLAAAIGLGTGLWGTGWSGSHVASPLR